MGAWIEIMVRHVGYNPIGSLPTWERGLKCSQCYISSVYPSRSLHGSVDWNPGCFGECRQDQKASLPTWERGLKSLPREFHDCSTASLPTWERGLKLLQCVGPGQSLLSLPTWERGLKSADKLGQQSKLSRSLHGSVDWNRRRKTVARCRVWSLPTWERQVAFPWEGEIRRFLWSLEKILALYFSLQV